MKFSWLSRRARTVFSKTSTSRPKRSPGLAVESLEARDLMAATIFVVPLSQPVDVTHRHSLTSAMPFAGPTGTVIIEPGATADAGAVDVTLNSLTIKGDPNAPGSILPRYNLNINTSQVTLTNLNLGDVTVAANANNLSISRSQLIDFTETGAASGAGHNTLSQNIITGAVDLQGNSGLFQKTSDLIEHNTFQSTAPIMLKLTNSSFTEVRDNSFQGDGGSQDAIQVRSNSDQVVVANNHVELTGQGTPTSLVLSNTGGATGNILGAKVLDNVFSSGGVGKGIYCNIFGTGVSFAAQIEGNDLHGNHVGVEINGITNSVTGAGNIDLGGGSNNFGVSKGGNNFRGYTGLGGNVAINLHNTDAGVSVVAKNNGFDTGVSASTIVSDGGNGGGSGTVNAATPLNADRAFVQTLYTDLLGRAGDSAAGSELDGWVSQLPAIGRGGVVHNILYSSESLNRIVDRFYLTYLGRESGAAERAGWVSDIQGGKSIDQVEAGFISSPEFQAHINTDFVQAVYLNILQRTGGPSELAFWNNALPQLGLQGVAASFTGSQEHRTRTVTNYFQDLLHRAPGANEAEGLAGLPGDLLSLEALVLGSDEFYKNG